MPGNSLASDPLARRNRTVAVMSSTPVTPLPIAALNAQSERILTPSAAAKSRFGAPNIAEAAALSGAGEGGRLIGPRLKGDGATCAIALSPERP